MVATKQTTPPTDSCLICDAGNPPAAALCGECYAPLSLGRDALEQERAPRIISVIGDTNVGKTVYLGCLLDMLSKRAANFTAIPKGAYSIDLQQTVVANLAARRFPPKTPSEVDQWHWAYYQVTKEDRRAQSCDLVMPDMAGEALAWEINNPSSINVIRRLMQRSTGVMLLVDAAAAASASPHPDFFALKLLTYIDDVRGTKRNQRVATPVAIVLCKGDYCPECFEHPLSFARTNLNRTWNFCEARFERVAFFAASVVGAVGFSNDESDNVVPIPLHVAPRGVLEPLEWLLPLL